MSPSDKDKKTSIKLFEDYKVRTSWDNEKELWYFSVIDIVAILTESKDPTAYWRKLKQRLKAEGNETVTNCHGLKMKAPDGKMRMTDVLDTEGVLRLIQSIPSPKAEPFKLWLAKVGSERLDEMQDPELAIDRAMKYYLAKGYSPEWINQRLKSIEIRKALTDEWQRSGVKDSQYAILTDIITKEWSGMKTREYKDFKGLKKESLRDNMSNMELVLNMLAEVSTTEISKQKNPKTLEENKSVAKQGGSVAKEARKKLELETGKSAITDENFLPKQRKVRQIKQKD
ncbi:Bro-N domain-containing protein [bacterium]|nr:Bro-N domain-containing protein [bacterium]